MPPTAHHQLAVFHEYLDMLIENLNAYPTEESLWLCPPNIPNCAGNLAIHLMGNLNHFIGAAIGKTGYRRNRPLEFEIKDIPRCEIIRWIEKTRGMLDEVIPQIESLSEPYPEGFRDYECSITHELGRLLAHLAYHVGQINYHRRLLVCSQAPNKHAPS